MSCRSQAQEIREADEEQSRLVNLIDSNSRWDGVTLTPIYKKPFDFLAEGLECTTGGADRGAYPNFRRFWRGIGRLDDEPAGELGRDLVGALVPELAAAA